MGEKVKKTRKVEKTRRVRFANGETWECIVPKVLDIHLAKATGAAFPPLLKVRPILNKELK
jgi:hypothetical protein